MVCLDMGVLSGGHQPAPPPPNSLANPVPFAAVLVAHITHQGWVGWHRTPFQQPPASPTPFTPQTAPPPLMAPPMPVQPTNATLALRQAVHSKQCIAKQGSAQPSPHTSHPAGPRPGCFTRNLPPPPTVPWACRGGGLGIPCITSMHCKQSVHPAAYVQFA